MSNFRAGGMLKVCLFDVSGSIVYSKVFGPAQAGVQKILLNDADGICNGYYLCKVSGNAFEVPFPIMVIR